FMFSLVRVLVRRQRRDTTKKRSWTYPALPVGLYSLRSPSPEDPASGMAGLGHSVTIPRALPFLRRKNDYLSSSKSGLAEGPFIKASNEARSSSVGTLVRSDNWRNSSAMSRRLMFPRIAPLFSN